MKAKRLNDRKLRAIAHGIMNLHHRLNKRLGKLPTYEDRQMYCRKVLGF